jgi:acetyltransferase-like isoleucine patch superfamily enzyme
MNTIILKGSVIGDNCIVGAGSVVSGSFANNSVIAGNPATVIRVIPSVNNNTGAV